MAPMSELDELLGIDMNDPVQKLACDLVCADSHLIGTLIRSRVEANLSVEDVAERMGVTEAAVRHLEAFDSDPSLSTLRRYALAIGVRVEHVVRAVP